MAQYIEQLAGKIRNRPLTERLCKILIDAADDAGVDRIVVTSGGQARLGTPGPRTGSTRHDDGNAADLELHKDGRKLAFNSADEALFERFVASATARGATGIGAGANYMGVHTIHVGFGSEAYWGAGGTQATAPEWLKRAVLVGRAQRDAGGVVTGAAANGAASGSHRVNARTGLKLRSGAGTGFGTKSVLRNGTLVTVIGNANSEWVQVDLQGDGAADGFVFGAYLAAV